MRILEIGCGKKKPEGSIGIDICRTEATDALCDLNRPFPFLDDTFDRIHAVDVLEHLVDIKAVMEEVHRVSKPGAEVFIRVPHFSSTHAYGDFTHRHFFNSESFGYFTGGFGQYDFYTKVRFEKMSLRINFWKLHRISGFSFFANLFPVFYEKYLPFIFTAMNIEIKLKAVK